MNRKTNSANNGKLSSGQRSGIRLALATGATLVMLISAQLFASGASTTQNSTQVAAVSTTTQTMTASPTTTTTRNQTVTNTTSTGSIFSAQSQPVPSTHSSR